MDFVPDHKRSNYKSFIPVAIDQDAVPQSNLDVSEVDVSSPLIEKPECVNPVPTSAASQKPTKEESIVPSQATGIGINAFFNPLQNCGPNKAEGVPSKWQIMGDLPISW